LEDIRSLGKRAELSKNLPQRVPDRRLHLQTRHRTKPGAVRGAMVRNILTPKPVVMTLVHPTVPRNQLRRYPPLLPYYELRLHYQLALALAQLK
jgi:hypothetical protein